MATIITGPIVITQPGDYVLGNSFATSGDGIVIKASNVTIDLAGFKITGDVNDTTTTYGISAFNYDDITIRNGTIEGFQYGVYLSDLVDSKDTAAQLDGGGHLVENLTITDANFRGIRIEGQDNVVQNNTIQKIGGYAEYDPSYGMGIETFGLGAVITGNTIEEVRGRATAQDIGEGVGISVTRFGNGTVLSNNTIRNFGLERDESFQDWVHDSRSSYGIWFGGDGSVDLFATDNTIENFAYGITYKRTVGGTFTGNTVTNAYVPYYTPFNDGARVEDGGGNSSDLSPSYLALRRSDAGQVETTEIIYLPQLHRDEDFYFEPVRDLNGGDETHTGGGGIDFVDYWGASTSVVVSLETNTATGGGGTDTLVDIEGAQGGLGADTLTGNSASNLLAGAEANDVLSGLGGADFLFGDAGADTLRGGEGDDRLTGGAGADALDGGEGTDIASYDSSTGITVSLVSTSLNTGYAAGDTFVSIEGLRLTEESDIGYGNESDNQLFGRGGDDMLYGSLGADLHDGGDGLDHARYDDATYGNLTVSLGNPIINTGAAFGDTYTSIEGLIGGSGNDRLYGDSSGNYLYGLTGNDMLYGSLGSDALFGGDGLDYARYDDATYGNLTVSLGNSTINTGAAAGDTFDTIEGLIGGSGNDRLYGDGSGNYLYGMAGNDMLYGSLGADSHHGGDGLDYARYDDANYGNLTLSLAKVSLNTGAAAGDTYTAIEGLIAGAGNDRVYGDGGKNYLYGMTGNDMLSGGAGADAHNGGDGFDYARYDDANYGNLTISLAAPTSNTGAAAGDTYVSIEGLVGGAGNDVVSGDTANNYLYGMGGDDTIHGGGGNDAIYGGAGNDDIVIRSGNDHDTLYDFVAGTGVADQIDFAGLFASFNAVLDATVQVGANVEIRYNSGDSTDYLTIANTLRSALVQDDFIL